MICENCTSWTSNNGICHTCGHKTAPAESTDEKLARLIEEAKVACARLGSDRPTCFAINGMSLPKWQHELSLLLLVQTMGKALEKTAAYTKPTGIQGGSIVNEIAKSALLAVDKIIGEMK